MPAQNHTRIARQSKQAYPSRSNARLNKQTTTHRVLGHHRKLGSYLAKRTHSSKVLSAYICTDSTRSNATDLNSSSGRHPLNKNTVLILDCTTCSNKPLHLLRSLLPDIDCRRFNAQIKRNLNRSTSWKLLHRQPWTPFSAYWLDQLNG